jgi:hypothetical protein
MKRAILLILLGMLAAAGAWPPSSTASSAALAEAIQDHGGQAFDVQAYGAKGNGAADDTAAIKAADTAAAAVCGSVLFPPVPSAYHLSTIIVPKCVSWLVQGNITATASFGYHGVVSQIVLPPGSSLLGQGYPTLKAGDDTNAQATVYLSGGNTVRGFTLDGNGANNTAPRNAFIATLYVHGDGVTITGNHFVNNRLAIYGRASGLVVKDNTQTGGLSDFLHWGSFADGAPGSGGRDLKVIGNQIRSSVRRTTFVLNLSQVSDSEISSNQIFSSGTATTNCMALRDVNGMVIKGNLCSGATKEGINLFLQDAGGATLANNKVTGNVVIHSGTIAFGLLDDGNKGGKIRGNVFTGNTIKDANFAGHPPPDYDVGIRLQGAGVEGNTVSDNVCESTLTGQKPARRGWNACVGFDHVPSTNTNVVRGNVFTAADRSGKPIQVVRNLRRRN